MPLMPLSMLVICASAPDWQIDAIDVADAVLIGHEEQVSAVGIPLRVDVLALAERRDRRDAAGRHVEQRQPIVAGIQQLLVGRESIGDERNRVAIGRPRRLQVRKQVARDPLRRSLRLEIVDEQIGVAADRCRERDRLSVGRPRRVENLSDLGHLDLAHDVAVRDVENRQHRLAGVHAADDELTAVGTPRSGRPDELQAREMRVQRRVDQLAHDASGRRVREIQIDREQIARREKDDVAAVGADRRRHVGRHLASCRSP